MNTLNKNMISKLEDIFYASKNVTYNDEMLNIRQFGKRIDNNFLVEILENKKNIFSNIEENFTKQLLYLRLSSIALNFEIDKNTFYTLFADKESDLGGKLRFITVNFPELTDGIEEEIFDKILMNKNLLSRQKFLKILHTINTNTEIKSKLSAKNEDLFAKEPVEEKDYSSTPLDLTNRFIGLV